MHISKINDILETIKEMDLETYDHLERTSMYTFALAKELKLNPEQLEQAYFAGLLHDMGVLMSTTRHQKECAHFGSVMLNLADDTKILVNAIKHQHDFYLQEERDYTLLLSEIVALSSEYDELKNIKGLKHEEALNTLQNYTSFDKNMVERFDKILKEEDLLDL